MKTKYSLRRGFTIVELLVVIGILAVLVIAALFFLNPSQLESQGRDSNRVSDLTTLSQNVELYHEKTPAGSLGTSGLMYISIPDPSATSTAGDQCQGLGLATSSYTYHCAASSTYRNIDGTGWVPVDFSNASGISLATLPVDPVNTTSSGEYYVYTANGTEYEVLGNPESPKTASSSLALGNDPGLLSSSGSSTQYVYVGDWNGYVLKYDTNGNYISEFPVFGGSADGVAVDSSGNIYVADNRFTGGWIDKYDSNGNHLGEIGSSGTGTGEFAWGPYSITFDASGNIYAVDPGNHRINKYSSNGTSLGSIGTGTAGTGNGQFEEMYGVAVDTSGNIYVTDYDGSSVGRIEKFNSSGTFVSQFGLSGSGQLADPDGIAIGSNGDIYVTGGVSAPVIVFDSNGNYLSQIGSYGPGTGQFSSGYGGLVAIDANGNIYETPATSVGIDEYASSGSTITEFGTYGSGTGQLGSPHSIAVH